MSEISTQLARIENSAVDMPKFDISEDGVYSIKGYEKLIEDIQSVIDQANDAEFTEEDRKSISNARAFVNKFKKSVDRAVIDERNRVFTNVDAERKAITENLTELTRSLSEKLEAFDARVREEKRGELKAQFEDEIHLRVNDDDDVSFLSDISYADIEDKSWCNRSASMNKSRKALSSRLDALVAVNKLLTDESDMTALELLTEADWDVAQSIVVNDTHLQEKRRIEQERAEAEKKRQEEIAEAERRGREAAKREAEEAERKRIEREKAERAKAEAARAEQAGKTEDDSRDITAAAELSIVVPKGTTDNEAKAALANAIFNLKLDSANVIDIDWK